MDSESWKQRPTPFGAKARSAWSCLGSAFWALRASARRAACRPQAGLRHPALAELSLAGCGALTGAGLTAAGAYAALRTLRLEGCDMLGGANLAASVQAMAGLESLVVGLCPQMTSLQLQCSHLTRISLQGNRNLQEVGRAGGPPRAGGEKDESLPLGRAAVRGGRGLAWPSAPHSLLAALLRCTAQLHTARAESWVGPRAALTPPLCPRPPPSALRPPPPPAPQLSLRCARLAQVELSPQAPGMAAAQELRRITLASYAVEALHWAAFPRLEEVRLQVGGRTGGLIVGRAVGRWLVVRCRWHGRGPGRSAD